MVSRAQFVWLLGAGRQSIEWEHSLGSFLCFRNLWMFMNVDFFWLQLIALPKGTQTDTFYQDRDKPILTCRCLLVNVIWYDIWHFNLASDFQFIVCISHPTKVLLTNTTVIPLYLLSFRIWDFASSTLNWFIFRLLVNEVCFLQAQLYVSGLYGTDFSTTVDSSLKKKPLTALTFHSMQDGFILHRRGT